MKVATAFVLILGSASGALAQAVSQDAFSEIDKSYNEYLLCTHNAAKKYASQTAEPAATIVEGAFGECQKEQIGIRKAAFAAHLGADGADRMVKIVNEKLRPFLIGVVLDLRSKTTD